MENTSYNLHLKGFVGGADFDRNFVDYILDKNHGKPVNVLIDSLGGSLPTALSIASAFRIHGNVTAHFVGDERKRSHDRLPRRKAYLDGRQYNVSRSQMRHRVF